MSRAMAGSSGRRAARPASRRAAARSGVKGDRGEPGPAPLALTVEDGTILTLTMADGSQLACDLYDLLAQR